MREDDNGILSRTSAKAYLLLNTNYDIYDKEC